MNKGPVNKNVNFIGIGTVKSATTWIYNCLNSHPQIAMPAIKEVKFFNKKENIKLGIDWYLNHFQNPDKIQGEYTARYIYDDVASKIKTFFPDTKLIICLRNPVERAFSHYQYAKNKGNETCVNFESAIRRRDDYVKWGKYYKYLKPYYDLFPHENIKVIIFEDIKVQPQKVITDLYGFLGVDKNFIPDSLHKKSNVTEKIAYKFIHLNIAISKIKIWLRAQKHGYLVLYGIKKIGLNKIATRLIAANSKKMSHDNSSKEQMDEIMRSKLKKYYLEDICQLEKLISRNLSQWK